MVKICVTLVIVNKLYIQVVWKIIRKTI